MAIIIPSRNIFDFSQINFGNTNNKIEKCETTSSQFTSEYGNVLENPYVIHIYDIDENRNITFVANNIKYNAVPFSYDPNSNRTTVYNRDFENNAKVLPLKFNLSKLFNVKLDTVRDDTVEDLIFKMTTTVYDVENDSFTSSELWYKNYLIYDAINNELQFQRWSEQGEPTDAERTLAISTTNNANLYTQKVEITILGNYISKEKERQISYSPISQPSNFVLKMQSNELIQNIRDSDVSVVTDLMKEVVNQYKNGKEVYTIKCSLSKYYDNNGNIKIDYEKYPPLFNKYDIVEPYVFTSKGEVPLSTKADGTAKQFEVIGIDFSYKGVVWQELTIQEYVE